MVPDFLYDRYGNKWLIKRDSMGWDIRLEDGSIDPEFADGCWFAHYGDAIDFILNYTEPDGDDF